MWHSETEAEENLLFWEIILDLWVILKEAAPSHNRIWAIVSAWMQEIHKKEVHASKKKSPSESAS